MTADPIRKRRLKRAVLWASLILATPLYWYADYVWGVCGYDCAIFDYQDSLGWGPAAMPALYFAVIIILVSVVWLIASYVSERRQRKSGV